MILLQSIVLYLQINALKELNIGFSNQKILPNSLSEIYFRILVIIQFNIYTHKAKPYISGDIFQTAFFIENLGQFDAFKDRGNQVILTLNVQ